MKLLKSGENNMNYVALLILIIIFLFKKRANGVL